MAPSLPSILLQMLRLDRGVSAANSSLGQEGFDSGELGKAHVRGIWDILDTQQDLSPLLSWRSHPRQAEDLFGALMRLRIPDYKNLSTPPTKKAAASEPAPEVFSTPPKAKAKKRGANRRRRAQEMMRARITSYSRP